MPAIHTEDYLVTSDPRINLPPLEYLTAGPVREAAENFLRLFQARAEARQAVDRAERAVLDAQSADEQELADALLDGGREPKTRTRTAKAEAALADAKARWQAHRAAVSMAHTRLRDAVVASRDEWLEGVAADQANAARRYEQAAAELSRAHRDLVNFGGVAAMLRNHPESLTIGTYRPSVQLSLVADPLVEALAVVRADERASALVPAEDDAPEIAV
jgi:hypothetical protein